VSVAGEILGKANAYYADGQPPQQLVNAIIDLIQRRVRSAPCPARLSAETSGDKVGHDDERVCESRSYGNLTRRFLQQRGFPASPSVKLRRAHWAI
jgi:hypothetical protein